MHDNLLITHNHSQAAIPLGETWDANPAFWRVYVNSLIRQNACLGASHDKVMAVITSDLSKWNIIVSRCPHQLEGSPDDLIAWLLTHG